MSTATIHRRNTAIETMGHMAHHTDTLNKTVKTTEQGVKLAQSIASLIPGGQGVSAGLGLLAGELKTTKSVINATNIFERGYEWGTDKTRSAILSRWQKTANRIALTFAQFLESVLFIDKCTAGFFYSAAMTVCNLPILEVVKGCLYMSSAVFGLWYVGQDLSKAIASNRAAKVKQKRWKEFEITLKTKSELEAKYSGKLVETGTNSKKLSDEIGTLEKKIEANKAKLKIVSGVEAKRLKAKIKTDQNYLTSRKTLLVSVTKYENYKTAILSDKFQSIKYHKVEKYQTRISNNKKIMEKSWISIVVDIGKIVMISLGMFVAATSVMFPVLSLPASTLVITSLSLITNGFGLTKNIYSAVGPKPVKEPVFKAE